MYDFIKMLNCSVDIVEVCGLEVLKAGFYCGGEGVPVSFVIVCVRAFWFALVGRA